MLMVLFQLGSDRYAIRSNCVIEIVSLVEFKNVPHAPEYVAGLMNFRENVVPVIDLCRLMQKRACSTFLSSRIILVDYGRLTNDTSGSKRILGLLAERVTEVQELIEAGTDSPLQIKQAPYMGQIYFLGGEMSQCLEPAALLPDEIREMLFTANA